YTRGLCAAHAGTVRWDAATRELSLPSADPARVLAPSVATVQAMLIEAAQTSLVQRAMLYKSGTTLVLWGTVGYSRAAKIAEGSYDPAATRANFPSPLSLEEVQNGLARVLLYHAFPGQPNVTAHSVVVLAQGDYVAEYNHLCGNPNAYRQRTSAGDLPGFG